MIDCSMCVFCEVDGEAACVNGTWDDNTLTCRRSGEDMSNISPLADDECECFASCEDPKSYERLNEITLSGA